MQDIFREQIISNRDVLRLSISSRVLFLIRASGISLSGRADVDVLSLQEACEALDAAWRNDAGVAIREFVRRSGIGFGLMAHVSDSALRMALHGHLRAGELLVAQPAPLGADVVHGPAPKQVELVRRLTAQMGGALVIDGTSYRLVPAAEFGRRRRSGFEVVPRAEAVAVLGRLAERLGASSNLRPLLAEVVDLLAKDGPALSNPEGLVLLRSIPVAAPPQPDAAEPVSTPSQARPKPDKKVTFYSVIVVDEVGAPVDGIDVSLRIANETIVLPTSGAGKVRFDDIEPGRGTAQATLASLPQVRDKLKPRWKEPRDPQIPQGSDVAVREFATTVEGVSVPEATTITLVLTPFFECREIEGTHFDFGRSFVRSSAIAPLAGIAEALAGGDGLRGMIFGHTDLSGPEALNKELSERRAKAVHALLTHDTAAWEQLFSGTADGPNWKEKWDVEEAQHMLNALGVTDDAGSALEEDGVRGASTKQAIHRFQRGDYPDKPAEQGPLSESDTLGADGRRELFLAYAKLLTRQPVDAGRFAQIGGSPFMGCGEYNPLSLSRRDGESRRTVVFLFTPAAEPQGLPCQLRSLGPCLANVGPLPTAPDPGGKPPYRCKVYQKVAKRCPCQAGVDLSHDVLVRIPVPLSRANDMPHLFVMDSDDGTVHIEHKLSSDARALDELSSEIHFTGLPEIHSYQLSYVVDGATNILFDFTPYDELPDLVAPGALAGDPGAVAQRFAGYQSADDAFIDSVAPITDPNAEGDGSGTGGGDGDARGANA